jgi:phenylacetic acid degradation protein paaN
MEAALDPLFERHKARLESALQAIKTREFWSAFSEVPRSYGETAPVQGQDAFQALLNQPFPLNQAHAGMVGGETSPFGLPLGITYPYQEPDQAVAAAKAAESVWTGTAVETRVGIALEILERINQASFLIAHATQHTTGQAFAMAFQAGGPHAQDRALEAIAYSYAQMLEIPSSAHWEKPVGRNTIRLRKDYHLVPRGVGLIIGCATFPTWNSYPALFADLCTGNTVIVKPHPAAILPLAITVRIAREVLVENGLNPNVIQLAPEQPGKPLAKILATHPDVGIVDFTGSSAFGEWLRDNVKDKMLFTEEAGVNTVVIDSTASFQAMCENIAFSLSLYSGQMCTTPQTIFVPATGIETELGRKSFKDVGNGIVAAIDSLLANPERASGILGAIQSTLTVDRIRTAIQMGRVLRPSQPLDALGRTATPLVLQVDPAETEMHLQEQFGPISFIVPMASTEEAISQATETAKRVGAITASLYTTDTALIARASTRYAQAGVALSVNLIGGIYVNQSAAFSDYHVSGANPAGNACLTDTAYVASRFRVVCVRQPVAA